MNYKRFHTQTGSGKIIEASSMIVYLEQKDTTIYFLGREHYVGGKSQPKISQPTQRPWRFILITSTEIKTAVDLMFLFNII